MNDGYTSIMQARAEVRASVNVCNFWALANHVIGVFAEKYASQLYHADKLDDMEKSQLEFNGGDFAFAHFVAITLGSVCENYIKDDDREIATSVMYNIAVGIAMTLVSRGFLHAKDYSTARVWLEQELEVLWPTDDSAKLIMGYVGQMRLLYQRECSMIPEQEED